MKGYAAAAPPPAKRRWKGFALAVFTLVVSSLLVPLVFLLGIQSHFPSGTSGYLRDDSSSADLDVRSFHKLRQNPAEGDQTRVVSDLIRRFGPSISEDARTIQMETDGYFHKEALIESAGRASANFTSLSKDAPFHSGGVPPLQAIEKEQLPSPNPKMSKPISGLKKSLVKSDDETEKMCQLQFGSYCLWSIEHKEEMKDLMVQKLKDQLFVARAYYPIVAKLKSQENLTLEMKQNIQDHERMLSVALADADLPPDVGKKIKRMDVTITRGKSLDMDCNYVDRKLRQILDLTEDEALFHMRQSAFLYHLGILTIPKSLHCLSMRLTVECFKSPLVEVENSHAEKLDNPSLHHYVIFSRNVLASSVAINSTVLSAEGSENLVFHLLTDSQNYFSMKFWFSTNSYKRAVIHVENIEDYGMENSYGFGMQPHLSMSEEFRIFIQNASQLSPVQARTEYISVFGHAHFLLPDIFKKLRRLIVLDDDVVVQQDLSPLWSLDLKGKVIGAVEFCRLQLGQLKSYLVGRKYDKEMCVWTSGLNIIDLDKWREFNVSKTYQKLLHEHMKLQKRTQASWRTASLPTTFLAFQGLVYPLKDSWVLSGLGASYKVRRDEIKKAAVLHYNGNMKPWLEFGIPKYKRYWRYFLARGNRFMDECNVNP